MAFFSIIIPTYNSGRTLERCLSSVCSQEYFDYEVIIIDGQSADRTLSILEGYKITLVDRLRIFSEEDAGIYDAMNKGIRKAAGEWIYFLGSDDYLLHRNVLDEVFRKLENCSGYDFVYGDVETEPGGMIFKGHYDLERLDKQNICHQGIFHRRRIFDYAGVYSLRYRILSDWYFNILFFDRFFSKTQYIPVNIAFFSSGGTSSHNEQAFHDWRVKFFKRHYLRKSSPNYFVFIVKYLFDVVRSAWRLNGY